MYCLYRIKVIGAKNIPKKGNFLLVCNHVHALDPVLLAVTSGVQFHTMAKSELFKNKFLNKLFTSLGAFAVRRKTGDLHAIGKARKFLQNGENVLIFPEGTRSVTGELLDLKPGAAALSISTGVPLMTAQIIAPDGVKIGKKITIIYGSMIYPEDFGVVDHKADGYRTADGVIRKSFLRLREAAV